MIVKLAITNLVDTLIAENPKVQTGQLRPITLIREYRSLQLVCKRFHDLVHSAPAKVFFFKGRYGLQLWDDENRLPNCWNLHDGVWKSVSECFEGWQLAHLAHDLMYRPSRSFQEELQQLGNVLLNPQLDLHGLESILYRSIKSINLPDILMSVGQQLDRWKAQAWVDQRTTKFSNYHCGYFEIGKGILIIDSAGAPIVRSTEDWKAMIESDVSSASVSAEVTEWWVWELKNSLYFAGYVGAKAWVVDARTNCVHTNFEGTRLIGIGQPGLEGFEEYWDGLP
jgi:hypothetical protein